MIDNMLKSKTKIILLPGMMSDERLWAPQIKCLENDYDVKVFYFSKLDSIFDMALKVIELVDGPMVVIGTSMGGYVAQNIWLMCPERVTHLGLFNTNSISDNDDKIAHRLREINSPEEEFILSRSCNKFYYNFIHDHSRKDICVILKEQALSLGYKTMKNHNTACLNRSNLFKEISKINIPVTIIGGRNDIITPIGQQYDMTSNIANSRLAILSDCGHIASLEKPDEVNYEIKKLLER